MSNTGRAGYAARFGLGIVAAVALGLGGASIASAAEDPPDGADRRADSSSSWSQEGTGTQSGEANGESKSSSSGDWSGDAEGQRKDGSAAEKRGGEESSQGWGDGSSESSAASQPQATASPCLGGTDSSSTSSDGSSSGQDDSWQDEEQNWLQGGNGPEQSAQGDSGPAESAQADSGPAGSTEAGTGPAQGADAGSTTGDDAGTSGAGGGLSMHGDEDSAREEDESYSDGGSSRGDDGSYQERGDEGSYQERGGDSSARGGEERDGGDSGCPGDHDGDYSDGGDSRSADRDESWPDQEDAWSSEESGSEGQEDARSSEESGTEGQQDARSSEENGSEGQEDARSSEESGDRSSKEGEESSAGRGAGAPASRAATLSRLLDKPVHVEILNPERNDNVGVAGLGWVVNLRVSYTGEDGLERAGFTAPQLTGPEGHDDVAPSPDTLFPGRFGTGRDDRLPGLVALVSTNEDGAGTNVANLFNLTGVNHRGAELAEIVGDWIVGEAAFGKDVRSELTVAVVDDLDHNGVYDDAPDEVPDANDDGRIDVTDLERLGLASEVATVQFHINADEI
ncbi:hypothetical protein AB0J86_09345 [Micromonospora sp. NPDC049559]|uniref:hypothetical protein n=1 Tax=Micromonospora sp. NPDC049559 TaxID=3155923 RepID=UPI00342D9081